MARKRARGRVLGERRAEQALREQEARARREQMADAEATDTARRTKDDPATAEDGGSRPLATTTGGGLRARVRWAFFLLLAGLIGAMALDIPFNHKALEVTGDSGPVLKALVRRYQAAELEALIGKVVAKAYAVAEPASSTPAPWDHIAFLRFANSAKGVRLARGLRGRGRSAPAARAEATRVIAATPSPAPPMRSRRP